MGNGVQAVALNRGDRDRTSVARHRGPPEEGGEVLDPVAEGARRDALGVVLRVVQDAEDVVGQELGDRERHAGEPLHEKVDGLLAVKLKRRAHA